MTPDPSLGPAGGRAGTGACVLIPVPGVTAGPRRAPPSPTLQSPPPPPALHGAPRLGLRGGVGNTGSLWGANPKLVPGGVLGGSGPQEGGGGVPGREALPRSPRVSG